MLTSKSKAAPFFSPLRSAWGARPRAASRSFRAVREGGARAAAAAPEAQPRQRHGGHARREPRLSPPFGRAGGCLPRAAAELFPKLPHALPSLPRSCVPCLASLRSAPPVPPAPRSLGFTFAAFRPLLRVWPLFGFSPSPLRAAFAVGPLRSSFANAPFPLRCLAALAPLRGSVVKSGLVRAFIFVCFPFLVA